MHEYSMAIGIVNTVLNAVCERSENVEKIWVSVGILRAVVPEALEFSFDALKKKHPQLADAELIITKKPITGFCEQCKKELKIEQVIGVCPDCGNADVKWTGGNELFVEKIEITNNSESGNS